MKNPSNERDYAFHLSVLIIYVYLGYLVEQSGETQSLLFMKLPVIEEHWLPLYPLYLASRTQCLIIYLLYHSYKSVPDNLFVNQVALKNMIL